MGGSGAMSVSRTPRIESMIVGQAGCIIARRRRRCPAPGVERPTRPMHLAYAEGGNPLQSGGIQSPHCKSGPTLQQAQEGSRSEGRHAERQGERITRRIAPYGVTRKGANV